MPFTTLLLQLTLATATTEETEEKEEEEEETKFVGLTIWRLPSRGFAVGRFYDGRRATKRVSINFHRMDGGFNAASGALRRVSWVSGGIRARESRGLARAFQVGWLRC